MREGEVFRETCRLWPEQLDGVTLFTGTGMEKGDFSCACFKFKMPASQGADMETLAESRVAFGVRCG